MATYESKKYASIPIAATQVADGSVTNAEFQFINTVSSNVQTQVDAKAATAGATYTGAVRINDSQNLFIGSGTDLDFYYKLRLVQLYFLPINQHLYVLIHKREIDKN